MRKILAFLLALAPAWAGAQTAHLAIDYDADATTATYSCYRDQMGGFFGPPKRGIGQIDTSGSSTTVDAVDATLDVFADLAVGDAIVVVLSGVRTVRTITAKASADQVTVNAAINLSAGYSFQWWDFESGTGAEDCWIPVDKHRNFTVTVALDQYTGDGNGFDYQVQCRQDAPGASVSNIHPGASTGDQNETATFVTPIDVTGNFRECRVGWHHDTADDGTDTGGDAEELNISITLGDEINR